MCPDKMQTRNMNCHTARFLANIFPLYLARINYIRQTKPDICRASDYSISVKIWLKFVKGVKVAHKRFHKLNTFIYNLIL
jgi:hypothetical protein